MLQTMYEIAMLTKYDNALGLSLYVGGFGADILTRKLLLAYNTIYRELRLPYACFLCDVTKNEQIVANLGMAIPTFSNQPWNI